jgi:hypothetical protein
MPTSITLARETCSSATRAFSSASRRSFSSASAAAAPAARTSPGSSSSAASWTIAATGAVPGGGRRQLDGLAVGVDVALRAARPEGQRQRPVAEGLGQRVAQRLALDALGVEALDQVADGAGPAVAAAQQADDEGPRQRGEGDQRDDARAGRDRVAAADDLAEDRDDQRGAERQAGPQHGRHHAPLRRRRVAALLDQLHRQPDDQPRGDQLRDRAEDLRGVGVVGQRPRVARRVAGVADVAAQQEVRNLDQQRVEVAQRDQRARARGLQSAGRERQQHVADQHEVQRAEVHAERVDPRVVGLGQAGHEPREADRRHERAEAVVRAPRPGEDAGAAEAQPDERTQDRGDLLGVLVVAGDHQRHHDGGHRHRGCEQRQERGSQ